MANTSAAQIKMRIGRGMFLLFLFFAIWTLLIYLYGWMPYLMPFSNPLLSGVMKLSKFLMV